MNQIFIDETKNRLEKAMENYDRWPNAKRYSFENCIVFGIGLLVSLCSDPLWNTFNHLLGGQPSHPVYLGIGQIVSALICTFLLIQNIIRWRES